MSGVARSAARLSAAALVALVALVALHDRMLALYHAGDTLDTNVGTGVTLDAFQRLLGHAQFVLLACAAGAALLWARGRGVARVGRMMLPIALALVAVVAAWGVGHRSFDLEGQKYFYVEDDAFISLRYARNLARGYGIVFNPGGPHVEGYTNFLWVLIHAVIHRVGVPDRLVSLVTILISFGALAATLWAVDSTLRHFRVSLGFRLVALLGVLFDENTITWAISGLETTLLAALVAIAVRSALLRRHASFFVVLSIIPLVRSDAAILAFFLGLLHVWHEWPRRATWKWLGLTPVPLVAHVAFRVAYYGHPFPNTYYLKMIHAADRLVIGLGGYGVRIVFMYGALVALGAVGLLWRAVPRACKAIFVVALAQCAYGVYVGGDTFWDLRFVTPVVPLLYAVGVAVLDRATRKMGGARRLAAMGAFAALLPVAAGEGVLGAPREAKDFYQRCAVLGRMIERNTPPDAVTTIYPAGAVPYFAPDRRFLDVLGKNDEHIAHLQSYEKRAIGHDKFDFDYVYAQRPDVAFVFMRCKDVDGLVAATPAERERQRREYAENSSPAGVVDVSSAAFREQYYGQRLLFVDTPIPPLECLFARRDAPIPLVWSLRGTPPPLRALRLPMGAAEWPPLVFLGPRWGEITQDAAGVAGRRAGVGGDALVDVWLAHEDAVLELCADVQADVSLSANDRPIRLDPADVGGCAAQGLRGRLSREVVDANPHITRFAFRSGRGRLLELRLRPASTTRP